MRPPKKILRIYEIVTSKVIWEYHKFGRISTVYYADKYGPRTIKPIFFDLSTDAVLI